MVGVNLVRSTLDGCIVVRSMSSSIIVLGWPVRPIPASLIPAGIPVCLANCYTQNRVIHRSFCEGQTRPFGDGGSMSGLPESGPQRFITACRMSADIVAQVAEAPLWNSNLKQSNRGVRAFESLLRVLVRT